MADVRTIPAIRYATSPAAADLSTRIAPPYDVLDAAGKQALVARDSRNFVIVDLPHVPAKEAGPPAAYEQAAATLRSWLADGTLVQDEESALYVYHQHYEHAGVRYARKMFFARLRLEEFGKGSVFPHEQTFGGPKEDRLLLAKATRANLSPIFGLYEDSANAVARRLESAIAGEPIARGMLDGVDNRVWAVRDAAACTDTARMLADKPVFIADGHHRYGTALNYRNWLAEQFSPLPHEHPSNFVLCVFCAMEDAGLLILPTHRVLPRIAIPLDLLRQDTNLDVQPLAIREPEEAPAALAAFGAQAIGLWTSGGSGFSAVRPRDPGILDAIAPQRSLAWRRLGLSFLHAYLLERWVTPKLCAGKPPEIHYVKSAGEAVAEARATNGAVFLLQSTTMQELRDVCKAGDLMPQKSTFFYPKLASGLVVNPLE